jgi:formylglycine-generating enzyme required for sulfatase activity
VSSDGDILLPDLGFQVKSETDGSLLCQQNFVHVPAGPFIYGPEATFERLELAPAPRSRQELTLDEFWIGRYPVTYVEWKAFLDATHYHWPGHWYAIRHGWPGWLRKFAICKAYPPDMANYPMVDVSLADALAYCDWLSDEIGFECALPTEFQWEKAARGIDGRTYPWGEAPPRPDLVHLRTTHTLGLDYYFHNLFTQPEPELARCGWYWRVGTPLPVGTIVENVSPYGCFDMAGNIWEWTISLYNEAVPDFHVVKGGSWGYSPAHTACNCRSACSITIPSVDYRAQGTGFRVVINSWP